MQDLAELRKIINNCDKTIVEALSIRLAAVAAVGLYKNAHALPVYQPEREREILASIAESVVVKSHADNIAEIYELIMRQSRNIQMRQSLKHNIVLIGFMACGKSHIGRLLANITGFAMIDVDEVIVKQHCSINEIFSKQGETAFREHEKTAVAELADCEHSIIACGGGAVLAEDNVDVLKKKGFIVWLNVGFDDIVCRLEGECERPLATRCTTSQLKVLFNERLSCYKKTADIIIDADGKSADIICQEILQQCVLLEDYSSVAHTA